MGNSKVKYIFKLSGILSHIASTEKIWKYGNYGKYGRGGNPDIR